jgi:ABC-2 type transport system ATP-binding protein
MTPAICTRGLTRQFAGGFGVRDLDLNVPEGAIYGFLGPNGAGKTTTLRLLLDLLRPQRGEVALFGRRLARDDRQALALVGALVESPSLYAHLSGRQNLEVTRRLTGLPKARIDAVLERVGLVDSAERRVREYSLGMRLRLAIALALLGAPRLLILDEPGNGLDPAGIQDMRALLRGLRSDGLTVFVSSHLLGEIEQVASHVGVLQAGQLVFEGTLAELRGRVQPRLAITCSDPARAGALLSAAGTQVAIGDEGRLMVTPGTLDDAGVNRLLVGHGLDVSHLAREHASLESLFFGLTSAAPLEHAA